MNALIEQISSYERIDTAINIKNDSILFHPEFKEVDGLILLKLLDWEIPNKINVEKLIQVYGDRTGYECVCNEVRVNDYINCSNEDNRCLLNFALKLQKNWACKIKSDYPNYNFC